MSDTEMLHLIQFYKWEINWINEDGKSYVVISGRSFETFPQTDIRVAIRSALHQQKI